MICFNPGKIQFNSSSIWAIIGICVWKWNNHGATCCSLIVKMFLYIFRCGENWKIFARVGEVTANEKYEYKLEIPEAIRWNIVKSQQIDTSNHIWCGSYSFESYELNFRNIKFQIGALNIYCEQNFFLSCRNWTFIDDFYYSITFFHYWGDLWMEEAKLSY